MKNNEKSNKEELIDAVDCLINEAHEWSKRLSNECTVSLKERIELYKGKPNPSEKSLTVELDLFDTLTFIFLVRIILNDMEDKVHKEHLEPMKVLMIKVINEMIKY